MAATAVKANALRPRDRFVEEASRLVPQDVKDNAKPRSLQSMADDLRESLIQTWSRLGCIDGALLAEPVTGSSDKNTGSSGLWNTLEECLRSAAGVAEMTQKIAEKVGV